MPIVKSAEFGASGTDGRTYVLTVWDHTRDVTSPARSTASIVVQREIVTRDMHGMALYVERLSRGRYRIPVLGVNLTSGQPEAV